MLWCIWCILYVCERVTYDTNYVCYNPDLTRSNFHCWMSYLRYRSYKQSTLALLLLSLGVKPGNTNHSQRLPYGEKLLQSSNTGDSFLKTINNYINFYIFIGIGLYISFITFLNLLFIFNNIYFLLNLSVIRLRFCSSKIPVSAVIIIEMIKC